MSGCANIALDIVRNYMCNDSTFFHVYKLLMVLCSIVL